MLVSSSSLITLQFPLDILIIFFASQTWVIKTKILLLCLYKCSSNREQLASLKSLASCGDLLCLSGHIGPKVGSKAKAMNFRSGPWYNFLLENFGL